MYKKLNSGTKLLLFAVGLALLLTACKKETDEEEEEEWGIRECVPVAPVSGMQVKTNEFRFESEGGAVIEVFQDPSSNVGVVLNLYYKQFPSFKYEFWGAIDVAKNLTALNHENLNGKHIKDRFSKNRSVLFPDGTKVTFVSAGELAEVTIITIYDKSKVFQINVPCWVLEYSTDNQTVATQMDRAQADGETSSFETTDTGLIFYNIYREDSPNNKAHQYVLLGEIFVDDPNHADDYFDDPRLAHT